MYLRKLSRTLLGTSNGVCRICEKPVSTWSPLGAAFNALPAQRLGLHLLKDDPGLFEIPQLRAASGFYVLKDRACVEVENLVSESCSPKRQRKIVDVFDEMSDTLCRVADLAEFVRLAHPKSPYREAAEDATLHIGTVVEQLNTNKELYDSLKTVVDNGDKFPTTKVDDHVAELFLFDFEQSGIHFPEKQRQRIVALTEAAATLGQNFVAGVSKERYISKDVLPPALQTYFPTEGKNLVINSLQSDCSLEKVREAAYKIYHHPDPRQEELLLELLKARRDLAKTCGFQSYAHRATRGTTAENPEFVAKFLDKLNKDIRPFAQVDLNRLLAYKRRDDPSAHTVQAWDVAYLTGRMREDCLNISVQDIGEFFSLGACMEGLNHLTSSLFGVTLKYEEVNVKEVWAADVYKLAVLNESHELLGHIYCDFYRRSGKPNQDCHFTIRGGRLRSDGSYQTPIVVLMLNLQPPRWSGPCLLSLGQLENLAHEMGHALHSMLARTTHQHVAGTRCATDFAEVPSILMEYFLADPRVLRVFAKHFQTKETLPEEAILKLCHSKNLLAAIETQTQVLYSVLDQRLHSENLPDVNTTELYAQLQETYSVVPSVKNNGWQLRFSHLVGYGARYYSYLLSRSVASCIWQRYFAEDPFCRKAGEKYRKECLSHGGGKPPRLLLADFLGQEVLPDLMADALVSELSQHKQSFQNILQ